MKKISGKLKLTGLVTGCMVLLAGWAMAEKIELKWLTDFKAAQEQAEEKERPILVNFTGSDWCGWCIRLDKEVFSQEEFNRFAKNDLVLLMIDFPRGKEQTEELKQQNAQLAQKYGIRGFPTIVLLDAEGKKLNQTGYRRGGAKAYVEHLQELLKKD